MRIAYYCQHVLGIGHLHRSLEICRELAAHHEVHLIVGGPETSGIPDTIKVMRLPGLQMNDRFKQLTPCEPGQDLATVKEQRRKMLADFFIAFRPEVFVVELYPFGRKAFRFELDPVLQAIRHGELAPCRSFVSVRDILVERPDDQEKFEERAVKTANRLFDGILVHADPAVVRFDETFSRCADLAVPLAYTGFVTPGIASHSRGMMRRRLGLQPNEKLIVASIGGGNVGHELLTAIIDAFTLLPNQHAYRLQIFTGLYCPAPAVEALQRRLPAGGRIERFSDQFPAWLAAADLSISMAGYNTCMNIVQAGVPALVYPFRQNREQTFRATRLARMATIRVLAEEDLEPSILADQLRFLAVSPRYQAEIDFDGAVGSRLQIERWYRGE